MPCGMVCCCLLLSPSSKPPILFSPLLTIQLTPWLVLSPSPACRHFLHALSEHPSVLWQARRSWLHPSETMAPVTQHVYQPGVLICCWGRGRDVPHRAALVAVMGELGFMRTWGWMMRTFSTAEFLTVGFVYIGTRVRRGCRSKVLR